MDQQLPQPGPDWAQVVNANLIVIVPPCFVLTEGVCSFDTLSVPAVAAVEIPHSESLADSIDDAYASVHGVRRGELLESEHEGLSAVLDALKAAALGPISIPGARQAPDEESIADPEIEIRCGPLIISRTGARILWIESICLDTGESLLPDIAWLTQGISEEMLDARGGCLWERFSDGPARLTLEFEPNGSGELSIRPWIAPECSTQALRHLALSMRTRGVVGPSAMYWELLQGASSVLQQAGVPLQPGLSLASLAQELTLRVLKVSCDTTAESEYHLELHRESAEQTAPRLELCARFGSIPDGSFGLHTLGIING